MFFLGGARELLRAPLSPSCVSLFLGPALTRQSGAANSSSPSISCPSHPDILLQLHSILSLHFVPLLLFLLFHLCTMLPALQACRKRLDHSLSLPAENGTCFIEANPHVHCVHTIVHVHLDHSSVSSVSNVRILFVQHNNVSSSDDLLH